MLQTEYIYHMHVRLLFSWETEYEKKKNKLSQDVRGIIVQKHEDGLSYRKISKDVDVLAQNIASVIQKWKAMKTTAAL